MKDLPAPLRPAMKTIFLFALLTKVVFLRLLVEGEWRLKGDRLKMKEKSPSFVLNAID